MTACGIPAYAISGNHIYDGMTACGIPAFTLDKENIIKQKNYPLSW